MADTASGARTTVVRWERGASDPQPWKRTEMAQALRVSVEQLDELLTGGSTATAGTDKERAGVTGRASESGRKRLCGKCCLPLSRYNPGELCQSCVSQVTNELVPESGEVLIDGSRLAELRREIGMTQEILAERAGISTSLVSKLEQGTKKSARLRSLSSIARVLNVPLIPDRDSAEYRNWCRVSGTLSALMAKSLSNLGHSRNSREWWNVAHHLADSSGDLNLALLVHGEHIIHGLYENRSVPMLARQVSAASEIAGSRPSVGLLGFTCARAQVSVIAGDDRSAEQELLRTREILENVPSSSAGNGTGLDMFLGEAELRYTETWVYSHMGEEAKADRAADQAFPLYSASDKRSPVQIKLMQAFTRVRRGDLTEGIQRAQAVYEPLAFERTAMVDALARSVLTSVPAEAWKRPDVAEYRELVTSRAQGRKVIEA